MSLYLWNRSEGEKRQPSARERRRRNALQPRFEGLETRLAMSVSAKLVAGQLLVTGDNSGNTITVDHSGTHTLVNGQSFADSSITKGIQINSGTGNDTVNILATVAQVAVHGQAGSDVVSVGKNGNAQLINGMLSIDNTGGVTTLNVNDQADKSPRIASLTATGGTGAGLVRLASSQINYNVDEVTKVTLNGGIAGNTFTLDTPISGLTSLIHINSGKGNDTVNVLRGGLGTVEIQGQGGSDTVNIGQSNLTLDGTRFVTVRNTSGKTNLNVNDSADLTPRNVTLFSFAGLTDILGLGTIDGLSQTIGFDPAAVGTVTVNGGNLGNTFTVSATGGPASSVVLNTGFAVDTVNVQGTTGPLTINGQNGRDVVNVGNAGSVQQIAGPVTVTNFDSFTALTVDDSAGTQPRSVSMEVGSDGFGTISGMGAMIRYRSGDVSSAVVKGGKAGNIFTILNTVNNGLSPLTTINSGTGADIVSVFNTTGPLTINGQDGRDAVNVFVSNPSQSVSGALTVTNLSSFTALNVDASAFAGPEFATLDASGGTGVIRGLSIATISYNTSDVNSVQVSGGPDANFFTVKNTASSFFGVNTILDPGTGDNTVFVEGTTGPLSISGHGGFDSIAVGLPIVSPVRGPIGISNPGGTFALDVDDSQDVNPTTVQVNSNSIIGPGPVQIELLQTAALDSVEIDGATSGANGGNTFFVRSTPSGVPVIINPGDGHDTINVGSSDNKLDGIQGPLTITGSGDTDTLNINDQGNTTPHTYTITPFSVDRSGAATIGFPGFITLNVNKGAIASDAPQAAGLTLTRSIRAGDLGRLTGQLVDADRSATLTLTVDWGDGSMPDVSKPGHKAFRRSHRYAAPGTYTVRAIWTDAHTGASNFRDRPITVKPAEHGHGLIIRRPH